MTTTTTYPNFQILGRGQKRDKREGEERRNRKGDKMEERRGEGEKGMEQEERRGEGREREGRKR